MYVSPDLIYKNYARMKSDAGGKQSSLFVWISGDMEKITNLEKDGKVSMILQIERKR